MQNLYSAIAMLLAMVLATRVVYTGEPLHQAFDAITQAFNETEMLTELEARHVALVQQLRALKQKQWVSGKKTSGLSFQEKDVLVSDIQSLAFFDLNTGIRILSVELGSDVQGRTEIFTALRERGFSTKDRETLAELIHEGLDVDRFVNNLTRDIFRSMNPNSHWLEAKTIEASRISDSEIDQFIKDNHLALTQEARTWTTQVLSPLSIHGRKVLTAYVLERFQGMTFGYMLEDTPLDEEIVRFRKLLEKRSQIRKVQK